MNSKPAIPYVSQFFILIGLTAFFFLLGGGVALQLAANKLNVGLMELEKALLLPQNVGVARWLQFITTLIVFCIPAFIFAVIVSRPPLKYLGFNTKLSGRQLGTTVLILFAAIFLSNALSQLSLDLPLPASIRQMARRLDEQYLESVKSLARMESIKDYFISLFIIAILPAIFEELLFRSTLQTVLTGWFNSALAAIIVTSILFSAIHFSIFGFLTRFALSMVLGYLFYYSKNIWLNIFFHFLNNGMAITMAYLFVRQGKPLEKSIDTPMPAWYGIFALAALILLFRLLKKESTKLAPVDPNAYLKQRLNPFQDNFDLESRQV